MNIDTIAVYLIHALLAAPAVGVATVFMVMLTELCKPALFRSHRFASSQIASECCSNSSERTSYMESRVLEARHELASLRDQGIASPVAVSRSTVARVRDNSAHEVSA